MQDMKTENKQVFSPAQVCFRYVMSHFLFDQKCEASRDRKRTQILYFSHTKTILCQEKDIKASNKPQVVTFDIFTY